MDISAPFVSCITPTRDRRDFIDLAIKYFARQDFPNKELIIVDDGNEPVKDLIPDGQPIRYIFTDKKLTIGTKRNLACDLAKGNIIVHWDDDDWMAYWRLRYQISELLRSRGDICGLNRILYFDIKSNLAWKYIHESSLKPWIAGNSFCYKKSLWRKNPFLDITVGEDNRFLSGMDARKIVNLINHKFLVAFIHASNASPKLKGAGWHSYPAELISRLVGHDLRSYIPNSTPGKTKKETADTPSPASCSEFKLPLISCIMLTYNRRFFIPQAIRYFLRQSYPRRELIIIDDGTDPVQDLVPNDRRIRYLRMSKKCSLGAKRNIGCSLANGEVIIWCDDDDWYAKHRIAYQVDPILKNRADITALKNGLMFSTEGRQFWLCSNRLNEKMLMYGVLGGTAAFRKRLWGKSLVFPDYSVAEEAAFIKAAVQSGARLKKLENVNVFIYVRHNFNTWRFKTGQYLDNNGWIKVDPPAFMSNSDRYFFGVEGKGTNDKDIVAQRANF